jgi:hypothetical protein
MQKGPSITWAPPPMHFSPRQEVGGNEDDTDDDVQFAEVYAIQDDTQNKIVFDAKILISKQDQELNLNH